MRYALLALLLTAACPNSALADSSGQLVIALQGGCVEGLLVVLDHTSSMGERLAGEVKITVVKEVLLDVLADLGAGVKIGLRDLAGCGMSHLLVPICPLDEQAFTREVMALTPHGATSIAYALEQIHDDFADVDGRKLVLLITDGMETCGGDPLAAVEHLMWASPDLRVNVVGLDMGRASETRNQMEQIAQATGGTFLEASSREELWQALSLSAPLGYSVYDLSDTLVCSGQIGEETRLQLPAGTYRVVIHSSPAVAVDRVAVVDQRTTVVTVEQQGGMLHIDVDN